MTSQELFDQGYAIPVFNFNGNRSSWRHGDQVINLPTGAVQLHQVGGFDFRVARWSDVLAYKEQSKHEA